jgi:hypothetical protein
VKKVLLVLLIQLLVLMNLYSQEDFYTIDSIQEIRIVFQGKNWKHVMDSVFQTTNGEGRCLCDVIINGQRISNAGIRYKGFSSVDLKGTKNPFNIDLAYTRKNKNYQGYTSLRLSNVNYDPSFIREVFSYEIARKYMPASHANFANVYINDTLIGLYSNVEAVNTKFISKYFPTNDNSFIKGSPSVLEYPFGENANLADSHGTDSLNYMPFYELESDYGWSDLYHFIQVLNDEPDSVEEVLNVDRTLWMHAFNYTLLNFDSYVGYSQNYYIYKDDNGKFNTIPWDMNMSFGSFRDTDGSYHFTGLTINEMKTADPLAQLSFSVSPRPLMTTLCENDTYKRMFLAHIRTIVDENFRDEGWYLRGQHFQDIIDQAVVQDTNKFYTYEFFKENLTNSVGAHGSKDEFPGIKEIIEARVAYLDTYPGIQGSPVISDVLHEPAYPEQGKTVWITAKVQDANNVFLGYRYNQSGDFLKTNLFDDGSHHDSLSGDGIFGGEIPVKGSSIQFYIYAENDGAGRFMPERAEYEFFSIQPRLKKGDLTINELMVQNETDPDPEGNYSSWIECSNNTADNILLSGIYLTNDQGIPMKWQFPDTIICARGYLITWADDNITGTGIHCNFYLSSASGSLFLVNQAGEIIDSLNYPDKTDQKSIGRYPNGWGSFVFMKPSFSAANFVGTTPPSGFLLYPNPARDNIFIEISNLNNPITLQVYDPLGKLVQELHFYYSSETIPVTRKEINISGLLKGVYYLRLTCQDKIVTKPFIVY